VRVERGPAGTASRPVALAVAVLAVLALAGCESSQDKNAKLEKAAKALEAKTLAKSAAAERASQITQPSRKVAVTGVTLLRSKEGLATVVTLHNRTGTPLREVPVKVVVRDASGRQLYTNAIPGQSAALVAAALIPAHGTLQWIDDQIPPQAGASRATAIAGEAPAAGAAPELRVTGAHIVDDPSSGPGAEGEVLNRSGVSQRELVVYAIARRGGSVVAAGRALVPEAAAHSSARFQLFFVGDPHGGTLEVSAPASTLH
jgi:outer membrane murein-binding lipoprotein Lpp